MHLYINRNTSECDLEVGIGYICSGYYRHLGLRSQHCRKTGDRYDYICSGYNRLIKYKVEGNMNGIFLIPPPSSDNQLIFGLQSHM